jgi:hypothetical protein
MGINLNWLPNRSSWLSDQFLLCFCSDPRLQRLVTRFFMILVLFRPEDHLVVGRS